MYGGLYQHTRVVLYIYISVNLTILLQIYEYTKCYTVLTVDGDSLVFAGIAVGHVSSGNPLPFPVIKTKRGGQWNDTTSVFTITESHRLYFVGLNAGVSHRYQADFTIVLSGQRFAGITRTSTAHSSVDTIGRDVVTPLYAADTVHVSNGFTVYNGAGFFLDTSINIFSISKSMVDEMVAFSVARLNSFSGLVNPVQFLESLYNAGEHYNDYIHAFIAPSPGVYYFSYSVGLITGGKANFTLYKDDKPYVNILRESTTHTGTDTIGRSVMMELEEFQTVHIGNPAGYTARSSSLKETSFSGFKYEPKHGNQVDSCCNINVVNRTLPVTDGINIKSNLLLYSVNNLYQKEQHVYQFNHLVQEPNHISNLTRSYILN